MCVFFADSNTSAIENCECLLLICLKPLTEAKKYVLNELNR
jgi:hypothetical protein